jgi:hypothetical protein
MASKDTAERSLIGNSMALNQVDLELNVWLADVQYGILERTGSTRITEELTLWQYKTVPERLTDKIAFIKLALIKAKLSAEQSNQMIVVVFDSAEITQQLLQNVVNDYFGAEYIVNSTYDVLVNLVGEDKLFDGRIIPYNTICLVC